MELVNVLLGISILLGLFAASIITFQHMSGTHHRSYDNWLLPVFLAIGLKMFEPSSFS